MKIRLVRHAVAAHDLHRFHDEPFLFPLAVRLMLREDERMHLGLLPGGDGTPLPCELSDAGGEPVGPLIGVRRRSPLHFRGRSLEHIRWGNRAAVWVDARHPLSSFMFFGPNPETLRLFGNFGRNLFRFRSKMIFERRGPCPIRSNRCSSPSVRSSPTGSWSWSMRRHV